MTENYDVTHATRHLRLSNSKFRIDAVLEASQESPEVLVTVTVATHEAITHAESTKPPTAPNPIVYFERLGARDVHDLFDKLCHGLTSCVDQFKSEQVTLDVLIRGGKPDLSRDPKPRALDLCSAAGVPAVKP